MNLNYEDNPEEINQNNLYENKKELFNISHEQDINENEYEQEYDNEFEHNNDIENDNNNNENNNSTMEDGKKPIYVMSLELEDGEIAKIKIYSDSNPNELAQEFCKKNNLDPDAAEYLASQIEALIQQFNNEENLENDIGDDDEENGEENIENLQIEDDDNNDINPDMIKNMINVKMMKMKIT